MAEGGARRSWLGKGRICRGIHHATTLDQPRREKYVDLLQLLDPDIGQDLAQIQYETYHVNVGDDVVWFE